jgi:hypothetical protein
VKRRKPGAAPELFLVPGVVAFPAGESRASNVLPEALDPEPRIGLTSAFGGGASQATLAGTFPSWSRP